MTTLPNVAALNVSRAAARCTERPTMPDSALFGATVDLLEARAEAPSALACPEQCRPDTTLKRRATNELDTADELAVRVDSTETLPVSPNGLPVLQGLSDATELAGQASTLSEALGPESVRQLVLPTSVPATSAIARLTDNLVSDLANVGAAPLGPTDTAWVGVAPRPIAEHQPIFPAATGEESVWVPQFAGALPLRLFTKREAVAPASSVALECLESARTIGLLTTGPSKPQSQRHPPQMNENAVEGATFWTASLVQVGAAPNLLIPASEPATVERAGRVDVVQAWAVGSTTGTRTIRSGNVYETFESEAATASPGLTTHVSAAEPQFGAADRIAPSGYAQLPSGERRPSAGDIWSEPTIASPTLSGELDMSTRSPAAGATVPPPTPRAMQTDPAATSAVGLKTEAVSAHATGAHKTDEEQMPAGLPAVAGGLLAHTARQMLHAQLACTSAQASGAASLPMSRSSRAARPERSNDLPRHAFQKPTVSGPTTAPFATAKLSIELQTPTHRPLRELFASVAPALPEQDAPDRGVPLLANSGTFASQSPLAHMSSASSPAYLGEDTFVPRLGPDIAPHRQLTDAIVRTREGRIEILLDPVELGRVTVMLGTDDQGGLGIVAERPETRDLIHRHSEQLLRDLRENGMPDARLDFLRSATDRPLDDRFPALSGRIADERHGFGQNNHGQGQGHGHSQGQFPGHGQGREQHGEIEYTPAPCGPQAANHGEGGEPLPDGQPKVAGPRAINRRVDLRL